MNNNIKRSTERILIQNAWYQKLYHPQITYSNIEKQKRINSLSFVENLKIINSFNSQQLEIKKKRKDFFLPQNWRQQSKKQSILSTQVQYKFEEPILNMVQSKIMNNIRLNDLQYQNLLIEEKQIDLKILEQQSIKKDIINRQKKLRKPYEKIDIQVSRLEKQIKRKSQYVKFYYDYLAKKLCVDSNQIFKKKIQNQNQLQIEYEQAENKFIQQIEELNYLNKKMQQHLKDMIIQREKLAQKIETIKNQKLAEKNIYQNLRIQYQAMQIQYRKNIAIFEQIVINIKNAQSEENQILQQLKNLKQILSIQQQHSRACLVIQRAIILRQTQKVIQQVIKRDTAKQYQQKLIPQLLEMLKQKRRQNQTYLRKIDEKKRNRDNQQELKDDALKSKKDQTKKQNISNTPE